MIVSKEGLLLENDKKSVSLNDVTVSKRCIIVAVEMRVMLEKLLKIISLVHYIKFSSSIILYTPFLFFGITSFFIQNYFCLDFLRNLIKCKM